MEKMEIDICSSVVYFTFGPNDNEIYDDEGQPGLEVGRDKQTGRIIGYLALDLLRLYPLIMNGLRERPIPGRFAITAVSDEAGTHYYDDLTDLTFPEVVQWVYDTYFAPAAQPAESAPEPRYVPRKATTPALALREDSTPYQEQGDDQE